jgi:hypothetical protein
MLRALASLGAAASGVAVAMTATVTSAAPVTTRTGQEPREERVELGYPIGRNVDRDLRVLRVRSEIRLHVYLFLLLTYASIAQVNT